MRSPKCRRSKKSSPKIIVHDNALVRAFERPVGSSLAPERLGHYFENAIGARLIESGWEVYYWRERDLEVDFVALGPDGEKWAIEVKFGNITEKDLKGIRKFCERHPDFEPCCVLFSKQDLPDIKILSGEEILSKLRSY